MLKYIILIALISTTYAVPAQMRLPEWHLVRVHLSSSQDEELLHALELEFDHAHGQRRRWIDVHLTDESVIKLRNSGLQFDVLQRDMQTWYAHRLASKPQADEQLNLPDGMRLGSVGAYYQLEEAYAEMERMRARFGAVVSRADTLGISFEGRPILAWEIHDAARHSGIEPPGELLITALHHAREPASVTTVVYALWNILGRYERNDGEIQDLLAQRRLIVVPILNPDGWQLNVRLTPNGGGLWRKNVRAHADGEFGVDLNRNYGPDAAWDAENGGSSSDTRSELYRGPSAFSEAETQAIRDLCERRNIMISINFHSFGELFIQPFSYRSALSDDSLAYDAFFRAVSAENGYASGRDELTVRYNARGVADDWMRLGSDLPAPIRAFTPEVGSAADGFWPPRYRIPQIGRENLQLIEEAWWSAGANLRVSALRQSNNINASDSLYVRLQNIGTQSVKAGAVIGLVAPDLGSNGVNLTENLESEVAPGELVEIGFRLDLGQYWLAGDALELDVELEFNDVARRSTHTVQLGQFELLHLAAQDWTQDQDWGVETAADGAVLLSDSPAADYSRRRQRISEYIESIDLRAVRRANLTMRARWQIEANFDGFFVEISLDDGRSWRELSSKHMKRATSWPGSAQEAGRWYLQGSRLNWTELGFPLDQFVGHQIRLRFGLLADAANNYDGILLRDILIRSFTDEDPKVNAFNGLRLSVSPNPLAFEQPLRIQVGADAVLRNASLDIYNVLGVRTLSRNFVDLTRRGNDFFVDLRSLGTGRYLVVMRNELGSHSVPLLIVR